MAELGQTADPRALIPGAPETIDADAGALTLHGRRVEQVGTRLRSVSAGDWTGPAGERFAQMWVAEPPKWLKVADAVGAAAATMRSYAGMLRWAQGQAAGAVTLWEQADALTRQAAATYEVASTGAAGRREYLAPFVDPGSALRREAQDMLAHARDQLRSAGDQAARAIGGSGLGRPPTTVGPAPGAAPGTAVDAVKDALTGSASASGGYSGGGVDAQYKAGANGLTYGAEVSGPDLDLAGGELSLGEVKAHAYLADASASGSLSAGGLHAAATSSASFGGDASASAAISKDGLNAELAASDGLRASVVANGSYGILGARAAVEAAGGVEGELGIDATQKKIGASLGAFAGGKAAAGFGADLGGIGVGMRSEAWAGVGLEAGGGYEFKDGKFHLHGKVGAALGVGGSEGLDITVDTEKVERTAMEAADSLGRGLVSLVGGR
jgi:hypothetical protein